MSNSTQFPTSDQHHLVVVGLSSGGPRAVNGCVYESTVARRVIKEYWYI